MNKFRALRVYDNAGLVEPKLADVELADLSPGEVVIKAEYSSLNYKDALAVTGRGRIMRKFPLNAGVDVAGTVVSSSIPDIKEGSNVLVNGCGLGESHDGGYADFVRVPSTWVVPLPPNMSTLDAMQIGTAGFSAALALDRMEGNGQTPEGGPIVVTGASGGVGSFAVDILAGRGYRVIAITGKHAQHDYLRDLGAMEVWGRSSVSIGNRPLERAEFGGAIDNLGGETLSWLVRTVQPWGNVASIGLAQSHELQTSVMPFILRGVSLLGISSANCPMPRRLKIWQRLASDMQPRKAAEITQKIITMDQLVPTAIKMLDGETVGRYVVKLGGSGVA